MKYNYFILTVLFFAIQSLTAGTSQNCTSIQVKTNPSFEEKLLLFFSANNGNFSKRVDLIKENPYNNLRFPVIEVDEVYQMNVYSVEWSDSAKATQSLKRIFPEASEINNVVRINSQVDIFITESCDAIATFAVYGFNQAGEVIAFTTTNVFYAEDGSVKYSVGGRLNGDVMSAYSPSMKYMLSITNPYREVDGLAANSLRLTNLETNDVEFEIKSCPEEFFDLCASVNNTSILVCWQYDIVNTELSSRTLFAVDIERRCIYSKTFLNKDMQRPIKLTDTGVELKAFKKMSSVRYVYVDDFNVKFY